MRELDYKAIGKRIKAKRLELGYTQEKLAEKADISTSHLGEIERGTSICSIAVLVSIAEVLNLNLDRLVRGIDDKNVETGFSEILNSLSNVAFRLIKCQLELYHKFFLKVLMTCMANVLLRQR